MNCLFNCLKFEWRLWAASSYALCRYLLYLKVRKCLESRQKIFKTLTTRRYKGQFWVKSQVHSYFMLPIIVPRIVPRIPSWPTKFRTRIRHHVRHASRHMSRHMSRHGILRCVYTTIPRGLQYTQLYARCVLTQFVLAHTLHAGLVGQRWRRYDDELGGDGAQTVAQAQI